MHPSPLGTYAGGRASVACVSTDLSRTITSVDWFVNGSSFESLTLINVMTENTVDGRYAMRFANVPVEYNTTEISCRVNYNSGPSQLGTSMLLLQGKAAAQFNEVRVLCLSH